MKKVKDSLQFTRRRSLSIGLTLIIVAAFAYTAPWSRVSALFVPNGAKALAPSVTTLISPTGDGGFETGVDYPSNGWTVVNGANNQLFVGSAPVTSAGANCAFSGTDSITWTGQAFANVNHFYRDITFPAGETAINLTFKYKINAPDATFDLLKVFLVPTSTTPVAGTQLASGQISGTLDSATTYTTVAISVPASAAGTTQRLVFSWKTDGVSPHAAVAVDEISLVSFTPVPLTGVKSIPGDYANFTAAITDLNNNGVGAGGVTFNVAPGSTFAEDSPCITATGTAANQIIFQKSGAGANPVVQPTGGAGIVDFGLCISGSDWVTFDGIDVSIATGSAVEYGYLVRNIAATNGAQNNTIKNVAVTLNRANTVSIGLFQTSDTVGGGVTPTSLAGGNSFNHYYNLNIQNVYSGIYLKTLVLGFDTNNEVGVTGAGTTTIGGAVAGDIGGGTLTTWGIRAIAQTNVKIFKAEVRNVTVNAAVVVDGIFIDQVGGTSDCFGNQVHDIRNTLVTATTGMSGIRSNTFNTAGPINRVYNNFVWNILSGYTGAAVATRQVKGISVQSNGTGVGATQMIDFNSVRIDATATPNISSSALAIGTTSGATMNIRNNILTNFTGAQAGVAKHYAWESTSATLTGIAGSVSDHNVLYSPNTNGFVGLGNATDRTTLADWRAATGQDAHSKGTDPLFVSATDLHIGAGATEVESGGSYFNGAITWVTVDYDGVTRDVNFPDIGADEGTFTAAADTAYPDIFFTAVANETNTVSRTLTAKIVDLSGVPTAGAGLPVLYFRKGAVGAFTAVTGVSTGSGNYNFTITYAAVGGVVPNDTIQYYFVAQDTLNNVGSNPSLGAAGFTVSPPAAGTAPTTPFVYTIAAPFTGAISVGTGETITSLTNAGGLFALINAGAVTGNITISLTSDLTLETGANALNATLEEPANSNYTITIKPSGVARIISGTGPAAGALIKLFGADRVTIDGSTSGGSDRSLTITNNASVTSTAAIWIASNGTNGAQNNTIKNCVISAGADQSTTTLFTFGIMSSSAAITTGGTANNNNTYSNNLVKKASVGIISIGGSSLAPFTGTVISSNQVGPAVFGSEEIGTAGILIFNEDGAQVVDNEVRFVGDPNFPALGGGSRDRVGIVIGSTGASWSTTSGGTTVGVFNSNVSRNRIHDIVESTTFSAVGLVENASFGGLATANTIANNMIWNVKSNGTSPDQGVGIGISNGVNDKVVYNSIYETGDIDPGTTTSSSISSFGISLNTGTSANLTLQDNISVMDLSSNTGTLLHSAINVPSGYAWGTGGSNRNDLFALAANTQAQVGAIGGSGGTYYLTLALWQAASGQDAASISADPLFTSPTDLHVAAGSPVVNAGSTIAGIANDIDNDFRPGGTAAEIGADELADAVPPETSMGTTPTNPSNSSSATFTFSGTDSLAPEVVTSFECKLDAASFATCVSPVNLIGLSDGSHTFQVRAKDGSGNVDPTPASFTWVIDTTAPDTSITANPTNPTNIADASFSFTGNDGSGVGGLTFQCKLDAGAFAACTSPQSYPGLSDGPHTFQVRASDSLGNQDATPASFTWTIDTIAPNTNILTNPPDPSNSANATFTFNGTDARLATVASFDCKLDAGSFAVCTSPQSYVGLSAGSHTFQVRARDTAGNVDATPASYTWTINLGPAGPVTVTATAGTTGPTDYATLKLAIDAINAGTHQGAITVSIVASTTEVATSVLNSSGAGSAVYTSVLIRPTNDGVTVAGPSVLGSGLIELNGADNVTIDGDNPNTGGTNRNLTIQNTAVNTTNFTSVIRIALAATIVTSADNCTIKNLILLGSATGRNIAAATSTTGPENTTYGIVATGGASTVSATTAPTPLASTTTTIGAGATATNLRISNNSINSAARAVAAQGSAATVFPGLTIDNNLIGNATAGAVDQVYSMGVTAQGTNNAVIRGNTVYVESYLSTQIRGLEFGSISATGTTALIEKNQVLRVRNNNPGSFGAYGINLGGGNTHTVQNNFVLDVRNDQTAGTGAFSTTFGAFGIRVASGTGHKVYHNSVHLFGALPGTVSTDLTAAFGIASTGQQNMDVRNNIFSNQLTGGNPTGTRHAAIFLPSGATVAMNLTLNNNDYYQGTDPLSLMAQVGAVFGTGEYLAVNFDPTMTTPATNFRAYTNPLSAAGTNDNASKKVDPLFVSNTNLHIAVASPMVDAGATVGVGSDIDGQFRVPPPDIGADEPSGITPPANDIAATAIVTPAPSSALITGTIVSPQASFTNVGTATQTSIGVQFTITGPGGYNYTNAQSIATLAPGDSITVTFAAAPAFTTVGAYVTGAAVTTPDANAANDTVAAGFTVSSPLSGTYTVGSGGNFPSLTNPGGIFDSINSLGATGNLVINIISDLTGETGAIVLNQVAGGFTVTIKPSGAARTITGTAANLSLIKLNGADNVTIDGSLSGGTDRSLTLTYGNTGGTVIWIASAGAANGAIGNTVKNCILSGNVVTPIISGVLAGSGTTLGSAAESPNNNNTIQNNQMFRVQNAAFLSGNATTLDQNWLITGNNFGSSVAADKLIFRGMLLGNAQNFTISNNTIAGVSSTTVTSSTMTGIQLASLINTGTITGNKISDIKHNNTTGWGSNGIYLTTTSVAANVTIANNFISDVASQGFNGQADTDNGYGITIVAGGGYKIYHNSVLLNTNQGAGAATGITAAINITAGVTTVGAVDLRDNVLASSQTLGTRYGVISNAPATVFSNINYNDYFAQNVGFIGGSAKATLPDWQTATGQDANSLAVDPLFVTSPAPADLHIQAASPMINAGALGTGILVDIDGDTRPSGAAPDIGADEVVAGGGSGSLQFSSPTYSIGEAGVQASITVTRTGGTGTIGVSYATVAGGSATGGGACGGTVDYVNTSGTLSFPDANSQSFNIPLCDDTLDEANETVNLQLSLPTGGGTLGAQSTAVLTLNDDDPTPSLAIASPSPQVAPEQNTGSHQVTFNVNLSAASGQTVTVHYKTTDGTATTANNDYVGIPDTIMTFNPGETSKPINVSVNGDFTPEPDESFTVDLSTPSNATIGTSSASATILNDDGALSTFSINDVRTHEGNSGTHTVTFTVSLFSPGAPPGFASVQYATGGGTATPGAADPADYMPASGTATFGSADAKSTEGGGTTQTQTFTVTIIGDVNKEPNETFFVTLSNPNNGAIGDGQGVCVINDEDRAYVADYDRDLKTDLSVFRPIGQFVDGIWYVSQSTNGVTKFEPFGANGDKIVPGDYDADGVTDLAVFRPSTGIWYIKRSSDFVVVAVQWGQGTDLPVQADYDGDDKTDIAVFRPSNGTWYILRSSDSQLQAFQWGAPGDKVVPGDYDGDGRADFAVFRPSTGTWFVQPISDVSSRTIIWGTAGDIPVSGDFDGDGSTDIAVFRPSDGNWYIRTSLNGSSLIQHWGQNGDVPVVGDYDADGISDIAVWRPTTGDWYILNSNNPAPFAPEAVLPVFGHWGQVGDKPVPAAYVPEQ